MNSLLPALVGAVVAGALVWLWFLGRLAALREWARGLEKEAARLAGELTASVAAREQLSRQKAELDSLLAAERAATAERLRALTEAHERLTSEFKALSSDALRANNAAFLELAKSTLGQHQQKAESDLTARQLAIDSLVKPLKESLEKVDRKMGEMEEKRQHAYGALAEQLKGLNLAQLQLQSEASKLSTALRSTSYVGSWGELQLRRVIEMADMLAYCDFAEQVVSSNLRADVVVRLPGGQRIVIDAKSPVQSYRDSLDAVDEASRALKLSDHAAKIRGHIDSLGAKSYWEQFQPSPEFVVLFMPGDHFLTAALQADNSLMERALSRKVLLATPTTLIALLKAAAYGWRQEAVSKNAEEISNYGRQLYDRIANFADYLDKLGRNLDSALKGYNAAVGSLETTLIPGARRFAELGAKGSKELAPPAMIETQVRDIVKRS